MRLADFILDNIEPILAEWEAFAATILPHAGMDALALRDHAEGILRTTVLDMTSPQTPAQQSDKARGMGGSGRASAELNGVSELHALGRVSSGFSLSAVVTEYRALRASVIRLWRKSATRADLDDVDDLTRFNEAMDQSLCKAVNSYTGRIDQSRQLFLAMLGHDLRNPLNAILLSAQLLAKHGKADPLTAETAAGIVASGDAMIRMIGDLLDFTGAGLGAGMPIVRGATNLKQLCHEVVEETRAAHPTRTLRLEADGDLAGEWDAARLRQLVSNLLGNAVQHGASDGPVDLSVGAEGDTIVLAVRNGGDPIPPGALASIFDPLARRASPELQKHRRPGSIGLGLYIAREVATAHGGNIAVESSHGAGTVFTVRLPRHPPNR